MHLNNIRLYNFKNYADARLEFPGDIQFFFGKNGSGKTNLLDAIHYLSFTRSALNSNDALHVRTGEQQFLISGEFAKDDRVREVACAWQTGSKKMVSEDGLAYDKFSRHIGKYPVVLIAPQDIELIWDGSELRRRFFDNLLSQINQGYLDALILYTQVLKQRNGLLRIFAESGNTDHDMLEAYDQRLVPAGNYIYDRRRAFVLEFAPILRQHYNFLAGRDEEVTLSYRSGFDGDSFAALLQKNLTRDIVLQRTSAGVHRDDFLFQLGGNELKRFGSQGQQKSFLIALKLAEFEVISLSKKFKPLLLLDDIFDKLDDDRIHKLMILVANGTFGQLMITDARPLRGRAILEETGIAVNLFKVSEGNVGPVDGVI